MAIEAKKVLGGYLLSVSPPHSNVAWSNSTPLTLDELHAATEHLGIHMQDYWDALLDADPSILQGWSSN